MKNNVGVLSRPSTRSAKKPTFLVCLLTLMLIVTFIFTLKMYEPVKNILVTGGIFVYPFTFLIIAYIAKYYSFNEAKKSVFMSAGMFAIFFLLIMLCLIPSANNATASYNSVVQYIFANNFWTIGNTQIFYPTMGQFCGILIAYISSHLLYASIYNAIHRYTIDYLAMGLSAFIAAIVDRVVFVPILLLENLLNGSNEFEFFIKCLTSEFIATIVFTMLAIAGYIAISLIKESKNKKTV